MRLQPFPSFGLDFGFERTADLGGIASQGLAGVRPRVTVLCSPGDLGTGIVVKVRDIGGFRVEGL